MTFRGKRIFRSGCDRRLAGVCGGLGEYFGIDPVLVRLAWVLATCLTGVLPGILGYLAAWLIVPDQPTVECVADPVHQPGNQA
jgi:phage shock protein C